MQNTQIHKFLALLVTCSAWQALLAQTNYRDNFYDSSFVRKNHLRSAKSMIGEASVDRITFNPNGSIATEYDFNDDGEDIWTNTHSQTEEEVEKDDQGRIIKTHFFINGILAHTNYNHYDQHNRLISITSVDDEGHNTEESTFRYNEHGDQVEIHHPANMSGTVNRWCRTFNSRHQIVVEKEFKLNDHLFIVDSMIYNTQGKLVEYFSFQYPEHGSVVSSQTSPNIRILESYYKALYDKSNRIVADSSWEKRTNVLIRANTYQYNPKGQLVKKMRYDPTADGEHLTITYKYNNAGLVEEECWFKFAAPVQTMNEQATYRINWSYTFY